jgi:Protein of unknown function (DUF4435)
VTNSIRANLTKNDIISEIKLSLGADVKKEKTFLLVEGTEDIKFWRGMINEEVLIFESFSGKTGIKDIIEGHFDSDPQVIGIRDKDYESSLVHSKIFYYDYSCMEMMFVNSDEAFQSIYFEYFEGDESLDELKIKLLSQLKYLSLIRRNNDVNGWGIRIDGVSIHNVFVKETKELNNDKIIMKLDEMNNNFFSNDIERKRSIDAEIYNYDNDQKLLDITQGHDFIRLFSIFCLKKQGRASSSDDIASSLRCAFRKSDFFDTKLFDLLVDYETRHELKIVS